jgi:hypothetical protein
MIYLGERSAGSLIVLSIKASVPTGGGLGGWCRRLRGYDVRRTLADLFL